MSRLPFFFFCLSGIQMWDWQLYTRDNKNIFDGVRQHWVKAPFLWSGFHPINMAKSWWLSDSVVPMAISQHGAQLKPWVIILRTVALWELAAERTHCRALYSYLKASIERLAFLWEVFNSNHHHDAEVSVPLTLYLRPPRNVSLVFITHFIPDVFQQRPRWKRWE